MPVTFTCGHHERMNQVEPSIGEGPQGSSLATHTHATHPRWQAGRAGQGSKQAGSRQQAAHHPLVWATQPAACDPLARQLPAATACPAARCSNSQQSSQASEAFTAAMHRETASHGACYSRPPASPKEPLQSTAAFGSAMPCAAAMRVASCNQATAQVSQAGSLKQHDRPASQPASYQCPYRVCQDRHGGHLLHCSRHGGAERARVDAAIRVQGRHLQHRERRAEDAGTASKAHSG